MKTLAVICNAALFGFTCLVLLVDGPPEGASYIVFTLWLLFTLILSSVVISRTGANEGLAAIPRARDLLENERKTRDRSLSSNATRILAITSNVVLLGFICWAFVDQFPHPQEEGLIPYTILIVLTPVLSLMVLVRRGTGDRWMRAHMKKGA